MMRADDFVIETISHFVRKIEGPPPVVPFHVDAEFETRLVSLCFQQQMSLIISEAMDELALPPSISRITIARIKNYASSLALSRDRRLSLLSGILSGLESRNITAAVAGDAWFALRPGALGFLRPVESLDLLINEHDWAGAVRILRELGFVRTLIQPRLPVEERSREEIQPEKLDYSAAEALYYHHYFSPLLMHNHDGDQLQLRFRVIDFGHAEREESAWDRVGKTNAGDRSVTVLSKEDQLIHTVVGFGTGGFVDLADVLDAGYLVSGYSSELDWGYIDRKLRKKGVYPAFYCSLEHVCNLLHIRGVMENLDRPGKLRRKLFDVWWRIGDVDYSCETEPTGGRFTYCLVECGGLIAKANWLRRSVSPKPAWVRSVYGRPSNLWLRMKFLYDVRSGRRRRSGAQQSREAANSITKIE